ncbi:MAG: DUF364 domain-containing protein [Chloroflexi bacterium]|nr:DUF364 domain-containing protein [Chloroflexota bacterium]
MAIAEELIKGLQRRLDNIPLEVEDLRIGIFYTAARLSDGHAGVAFTPRDLEDTVCCPRSAARMPASGKLQGKLAWELAKYATSDNPLKRSVGVAVVNALSARVMEQGDVCGGRILAGKDALDTFEFRPEDRVVMVGGFTPFIKKLKSQVKDLNIIDKHPGALKGDERSFWRSPDRIPEIMPRADVAVITGSAIIEGGLEDLLALCRGARQIVLAGPTASMWPEPLFKRGVTVLGGITVNDADRLLQVVSEGGSGYFFSGPARKIAIVKEFKHQK